MNKQDRATNPMPKVLRGERTARVPLTIICDSRVQNPARHTESATRELREDMSTRGQTQAVTLVPAENGWYEVADGHRRIASARALGWTHIDAKVIDGSCSVLWASANGKPKRKTTSADWFYGWAALHGEEQKDFLGHAPKSIARAIRDVAGILGEPRAREIGMRGNVSPQVSNWAATLNAMFATRLRVRNKPVSKKAIVEWLIEYGFAVVNFVRLDPPIKKIRLLESRIRQMQAFPRSDW